MASSLTQSESREKYARRVPTVLDGGDLSERRERQMAEPGRREIRFAISSIPRMPTLSLFQLRRIGGASPKGQSVGDEEANRSPKQVVDIRSWPLSSDLNRTQVCSVVWYGHLPGKYIAARIACAHGTAPIQAARPEIVRDTVNLLHVLGGFYATIRLFSFSLVFHILCGR